MSLRRAEASAPHSHPPSPESGPHSTHRSACPVIAAVLTSLHHAKNKAYARSSDRVFCSGRRGPMASTGGRAQALSEDSSGLSSFLRARAAKRARAQPRSLALGVTPRSRLRGGAFAGMRPLVCRLAPTPSRGLRATASRASAPPSGRRAGAPPWAHSRARRASARVRRAPRSRLRAGASSCMAAGRSVASRAICTCCGAGVSLATPPPSSTHTLPPPAAPGSRIAGVNPHVVRETPTCVVSGFHFQLKS